MKPGIVLFVVVLIVLVGGGIVLLRQGRSRDGRPGHKTLNTDATQASATRSVAPTADHPVSEQPLDTLSADGSGTAVAGAGAGGYTPDARRPLTGGETDAESSPDQS
ncbi:MAG: hypothetical protein L0H96_12615 [Humibacillus sp.]|nr:hypothetical protein [Humibacillus sp.]MDN5777748.1 hypothetical protein [Humibacillus sp.]